MFDGQESTEKSSNFSFLFPLRDNLPNLEDKGDLVFSAAANTSIDVGPGSNGEDSQQIFNFSQFPQTAFHFNCSMLLCNSKAQEENMMCSWVLASAEAVSDPASFGHRRVHISAWKYEGKQTICNHVLLIWTPPSTVKSPVNSFKSSTKAVIQQQVLKSLSSKREQAAA